MLIYKLEKNLCGRAATQLNWNLTQLRSAINIRGKRTVNGKSLVGILSAGLQKDDIIQIFFDYESETEKIKEYFNEVGYEVNEQIE